MPRDTYNWRKSNAKAKKMVMGYLIAGAVATVLLIVLCFVFIRKKWMAFLAANVILLLAAGILAYSVFQDFSDMQQNFFTQQKLFIMKNNGHVIGAFSSGNQDSEPAFLQDRQLSGVEASIVGGDLSGLEKQYYKIIVIDSKSLRNVDLTGLGAGQFSSAEAFSVLNSSEPIEEFLRYELQAQNTTPDNATIQAMKAQMLQSNETESGFRAKIFSMMFASAIKDQGPSFLLRQYKEGNIKFYPETITFSLLKFVPDSFLPQMAGDTQSQQFGQQTGQQQAPLPQN